MYWLIIIFLTILFSVLTTFSIVLLGDRTLLSGNLLSLNKIMSIAFDWRFITAVICAILARITFVMINSFLLKIPRMAGFSTTATLFITTIAYVFVVVADMVFLKERMTMLQLTGCFIMLVGLIIIIKP